MIIHRFAMKYIIKVFPEIIIKSQSVRKRMIKVLDSNIRNVLRRENISVKIRNEWDKLIVRIDESESAGDLSNEHIVDILTRIPGIHAVLAVSPFPFSSLDDIYEKTAEIWGAKLKGKTFCVRVKRRGTHSFTSIDVERHVGGLLNDNFEHGGVDLKNPDLKIEIEIDNNDIYLVVGHYQGLGGYPLSTQDDVLSLISGGFDSGVSSYLFIKRGSRVHYLFFNMGGDLHETGVKAESYYIWNRYGSSHRVKFIAVPFAEVVGEILTKTDHSVRGVILKRMMMRAGEMIAAKYGISALVTGESVGQVSSQTLANLSVIDQSVKMLILRPLIVSDKQDIIDKCREIGTVHFAESMPEYCGVISDRPTIHADLRMVEEEESKIASGVLEKAVSEAVVMDIKDIPEEKASEGTVQETSVTGPNDVILDVRAPDEARDDPMKASVPVIEMPFFKVSEGFPGLDQSKTYLLYCKNGVMSRTQAAHLVEKGFKNVKVFVSSEGACALPT